MPMTATAATRPAREGRGSGVARNTLTAIGTRLVSMVVGFSLTPFVVHALGLSQFGLFSIVGSLAGYLGLLDFGLGGAFVKFLVGAIEQERHDVARQIVCFGMAFYALFGLVLAVPVALFSPAIVHLFKMPAAQVPEAVFLLHGIFALLVLSMISGLPGMLVVAHHRMDLANRNGFVSYLAYAAATFAFLGLGWGIRGLLLAQLVQIVLGTALQYATARRLFGPLLMRRFEIDPSIVAPLFSFGGWTQATNLLNIVSLDVGRFISASLVSVTSVSYYEIGSRAAFYTKSLPNYFLDAVLPAAAAAETHGDRERVERMYRLGTFYNLFATLGLAGFLVGAVGPVIQVWMGRSFPYVSLIICFLTLGYVASALTGVGATIFRAAGMPKYEAYFSAIVAVANIAATLVLARMFGIVGVAMGTAAGWIAGTIYFVATFHRLRAIAWWSNVGAPWIRLMIAASIATFALHAALGAPFLAGTFSHRVTGVPVILVGGALYLALYAGLSWVLGAWRADEAALIHRTAAKSVEFTARLQRRFAT